MLYWPGIPVGIAVNPPLLVPNGLGAPPKAPLVVAGDTENMVARKGFAAPAAPVACGRKPVPTVDPGVDPNPRPRPPDPNPVG